MIADAAFSANFIQWHLTYSHHRIRRLHPHHAPHERPTARVYRRIDCPTRLIDRNRSKIQIYHCRCDREFRIVPAAICRLWLLLAKAGLRKSRNEPMLDNFTTFPQRSSKYHHFGGDSPTTTYQLMDERKVFVSNHTYKRATRGSCRLQLGSFLAEMVGKIA